MMKKYFLFFILLIFVSSSLSQQWNRQIVNPGFLASSESIFYNPDGYPALIYSSNKRILLSTWNGESWKTIPLTYSNGVELQVNGLNLLKGVRVDSIYHIVFKYDWRDGTYSRSYMQVSLNGTTKYFRNIIPNTEYSGSLSITNYFRKEILISFAKSGLFLERFDLQTNEWSDVTVVDGTPGVGSYNDIIVAPDGRIWISYYDAVGKNLKVARSKTAGGWDVWFVDTKGDVGQYSQISVDNNNVAHIVYYDATKKRLKYATFQP